MIYTFIQWCADKLAPWKTKLSFVAFADFCGLTLLVDFKRIIVSQSTCIPLHFTPWQVFVELPLGARHVTVCWLFLIYFSMSTSHLPSSHSSPMIGSNNGYFRAPCGAQPMGATNRISACRKKIRMSSDLLVSSWPDYLDCLNPTRRGYGFYQTALPRWLSVSTNNCLLPWTLKSGMLMASSPSILHLPWKHICKCPFH